MTIPVYGLILMGLGFLFGCALIWRAVLDGSEAERKLALALNDAKTFKNTIRRLQGEVTDHKQDRMALLADNKRLRKYVRTLEACKQKDAQCITDLAEIYGVPDQPCNDWAMPMGRVTFDSTTGRWSIT